MVDRPQSSRDPTQDVLAAIQEVIDAPHLPFPDGNPLWQTDVKKAEDERATDARLGYHPVGIGIEGPAERLAEPDEHQRDQDEEQRGNPFDRQGEFS